MIAVTVTNQKGGVGKTSTAHALITGLHAYGYKVLAIDLDPQTNLTYPSGNFPDLPTLYDAFTGKASIQDVITKSSVGYDVTPGDISFSSADMEFTAKNKTFILKGLLEPIKENYDYCIIDTPPTLGILTINALSTSDKAIIPMNADIYSAQGLSQLWSLMDSVRTYCNPDLIAAGILINRFNARSVINRQINDSIYDIAKTLNTHVFMSHIREAVAVKEVQYMQGSLFRDYPSAKVTSDYWHFIDEFLGKPVVINTIK